MLCESHPASLFQKSVSAAALVFMEVKKLWRFSTRAVIVGNNKNRCQMCPAY